MKKLYILLLFSIWLSNLFGQITLTSSANAILPGDSSLTHEIIYLDPGNSGENQVWDFSGIQYTGKNTFCGVKVDPSSKLTGEKEKGLILSEDGCDYAYNSGENGFKETGYVNTGKKMRLNYNDPIVKMKFPLSYGQQFKGPFSGVAWYNENSRIDLSGEYAVSADAFGTLILPDRILKNTLRIKAVRQSLQIGVCGSTQSNQVKYYWYASGYRYPVMMVGTSESRYGAKDPVILQNGWINLNQQTIGAPAAGIDPTNQTGIAENSIIIYPNPFNEQLTYSYVLVKQVPVMVELYDMSGQLNIMVEKKQVQSEGLHTSTLIASMLGLPPGVFYLRFTFDKQVVVSKIVKI